MDFTCNEDEGNSTFAQIVIKVIGSISLFLQFFTVYERLCAVLAQAELAILNNFKLK